VIAAPTRDDLFLLGTTKNIVVIPNQFDVGFIRIRTTKTKIPVWQDGKKVGFVTSGGFGHTQGKSLAMVLVDAECAKVGTALTTHIVGVERKAKVIAPSPYDPNGKALRV
jgi:glycine cleavage system aminomethyltransferase T